MAEVGGATGRGASIKSDRLVDFLISSSLSQLCVTPQIKYGLNEVPRGLCFIGYRVDRT